MNGYVYDPQHRVTKKTATTAETFAAIHYAMSGASYNRCALKYNENDRAIIIWCGSSIAMWNEKTYPLGLEEFNSEFERIRMNSRRPRIF